MSEQKSFVDDADAAGFKRFVYTVYGTVILTLVVLVVSIAVAFAGPRVDEVTGDAGLMQGDGDCVTPAEYDVLFGYANLSTVESQTNPGMSVAAVYRIVDDVASDRVTVFMGVTYPSFRETVSGVRAV